MTTDSDVAVRQLDCVIIDTNIWRSQLMLKAPMGVSLVYTLGRQQGFIGLPEVVERELTKQVLEHGRDAAEKLAEGSRILNTLTDSPSFPLPASQVKLEQVVQTRLAELTPILVRVPFTLSHASAALDMVNAKLPPNGKENQQFKDSAIWQAVLDLSRKYTVHFVTSDRGFFSDRNPSKGLAANLQEDCAAANGSVAVYGDLRSCLEAISSDRPQFDRERLKSLIESFVMPGLQAEATRLRYELKELLNADIVAFRTTDSNRITMDYTVAMKCELDPSVKHDFEREGRAVAYGSCYYDRMADCISDGFIQEIRFLSRTSRHAREFRYEDSSIPFRRLIPWD